MTKTNRHTDSFYANGAFFFPLPISIKPSKFLYEIEKEEEEKRRLWTDHNTTLINYNNLEDD